MSCEDADADMTGYWKAATTKVDQAKAENLHLPQYCGWACAETGRRRSSSMEKPGKPCPTVGILAPSTVMSAARGP
ncbi:hypothetical protein EV401DRAFT_2072321 [Pisolithus croceorrhizus]|nr:hypothetical protein EV401DRAFT_2072321 [Pisolithus croceorrhizus]